MDRIVLEDECRQITSLNRRELRSAERAGTFPVSVLLPDGTAGWLESDLQLWIKSTLADPVAPPPPEWFTRSCAAAEARRAVPRTGGSAGGGGKERRRKAPARVM